MVAVLYILVVIITGQVFDFPVHFRTYTGFAYVLGSVIAVAWFLIALVRILLRDRPARPIRHLVQTIRCGELRFWERFAYFVPFVVFSSLFFAAFTSMKVSISQVVPYYADPWAAQFDRLLHGDDPWRLLHPLFGTPLITKAIDFIYALWLFVFYAVLFFAATMMGRDRLRTQYLLAFVLTWSLLGSVAAVALASVGPCFYANFYPGDDPFADLNNYLGSVDIISASTQALLMDNYQAGQAGAGQGISALPSVHVAVAFLNVLLAWHFSRFWRALAVGFFAIILIGSVHLGWHYAIDGYASILAVIAIWVTSGWVARRMYVPRKEPAAAMVVQRTHP